MSADLQYFEPNYINEALVVLDRFGARARALAGGTRLGPVLRADRGDVVALVNLKRIPALAGITVDGGRLRIGALATAADLACSPEIAAAAPLVAAAAASMGSRQLRALATLGGNICSGDPASDLTVALLASDATCMLASLDHAEFRRPLRDVLVPGGTIFAPAELLVAVEVPVTIVRTAYCKMMTRRGFEMAVVAVAVAIEDDAGMRGATRIALAGAGPMCQRAAKAESFARSAPPNADERGWAKRVAEIAAANDAAPETDDRASAEYRRHLVAVLAERALIAALAGPR
jgi:CO/xanthine dehydrogenase FAD-binding subunit